MTPQPPNGLPTGPQAQNQHEAPRMSDGESSSKRQHHSSPSAATPAFRSIYNPRPHHHQSASNIIVNLQRARRRTSTSSPHPPGTQAASARNRPPGSGARGCRHCRSRQRRRAGRDRARQCVLRVRSPPALAHLLQRPEGGAERAPKTHMNRCT